MPNPLYRFGITVDDVSRARAFYEKVFQWRFEPWGPPDFYLIEPGDEEGPTVGGLMHQRRELAPGAKMIGFECTIRVDDADAAAKAIVEAGGKILMAKAHIPTVGYCVYFQDTEGNVAAVMQPEAGQTS